MPPKMPPGHKIGRCQPRRSPYSRPQAGHIAMHHDAGRSPCHKPQIQAMAIFSPGFAIHNVLCDGSRTFDPADWRNPAAAKIKTGLELQAINFKPFALGDLHALRAVQVAIFQRRLIAGHQIPGGSAGRIQTWLNHHIQAVRLHGIGSDSRERQDSQVLAGSSRRPLPFAAARPSPPRQGRSGSVFCR